MEKYNRLWIFIAGEKETGPLIYVGPFPSEEAAEAAATFEKWRDTNILIVPLHDPV